MSLLLRKKSVVGTILVLWVVTDTSDGAVTFEGLSDIAVLCTGEEGTDRLVVRFAKGLSVKRTLASNDDSLSSTKVYF